MGRPNRSYMRFMVALGCVSSAILVATAGSGAEKLPGRVLLPERDFPELYKHAPGTLVYRRQAVPSPRLERLERYLRFGKKRRGENADTLEKRVEAFKTFVREQGYARFVHEQHLMGYRHESALGLAIACSEDIGRVRDFSGNLLGVGDHGRLSVHTVVPVDPQADPLVAFRRLGPRSYSGMVPFFEVALPLSPSRPAMWFFVVNDREGERFFEIVDRKRLARAAERWHEAARSINEPVEAEPLRRGETFCERRETIARNSDDLIRPRLPALVRDGIIKEDSVLPRVAALESPAEVLTMVLAKALSAPEGMDYPTYVSTKVRGDLARVVEGLVPHWNDPRVIHAVRLAQESIDPWLGNLPTCLRDDPTVERLLSGNLYLGSTGQRHTSNP